MKGIERPHRSYGVDISPCICIVSAGGVELSLCILESQTNLLVPVQREISATAVFVIEPQSGLGIGQIMWQDLFFPDYN